jgi:hypothetical protein
MRSDYVSTLARSRYGRRAHLAAWLARHISPGEWIRLEYPPAPKNVPRYGYGRPAHSRLEAILGSSEAVFAHELRHLMEFRHALAAIPRIASDPHEPHWENGFMFGLDGASLYSFLRRRAPCRYVEIGSGNSTLFADRARRDGDLATLLTSIDPFPREEVDDVCDTVIRAPLQEVGLEICHDLQPGDIVFLDGTHRVFMNSDATVFFLDVLPNLPSGVLVGIHDIHLPGDYPPDSALRYFSEQYLLAAYLLADCPWLRPLLPCRYVATKQDLVAITEPLFGEPNLKTLTEPGLIFWCEVDHTARGSASLLP